MHPEVSATSTIKLKKDALLLNVFKKNSVNIPISDPNDKLESII